MIRSLLFWNIFPLAPILLKTLIACQQRKIKNQSTTSERFNMCHIERVSTAYSHVIASLANCTISLSVWNVFLWNISQLRAEVLFNALIYSPCMSEFCMSPVSFPTSLLCLGQVRGKGSSARLCSTLLPLGRATRERRVTSSSRRLKTKAFYHLNLLATQPLKAGVFFCLLNPPLLPAITDPSLPFRVPQGPAASTKPAAPEASPSTPGCQTWLDPTCSAHDRRRHFHLTISLLFMAPLLKRDEVLTFCQWPREGVGTPCRWLQ